MQDMPTAKPYSRIREYLEALGGTAFMVGIGFVACTLMLNVRAEGPFTPKRTDVVYVAKDSAAAQRGYALPGEGHAVSVAIDARAAMAKVGAIIGSVLAVLGFAALLRFRRGPADWEFTIGCLPILSAIAGMATGMLLCFIPNATAYWVTLGLIAGVILVGMPIRLTRKHG